MKQQLKDKLNNLLKAVEAEREAEREKHLAEMKSLSGKEREGKGRAFIDLKKQKSGRALGGDYLYKFYKRSGSALPTTEISIGDQVIVSQFDPLDSNNPVGTVYAVTKTYITVAFASKLTMSNSRAIRLDLHVNDLTFQRMEQALSMTKSPQHSRLQAVLSGDYQLKTQEADIDVKHLNRMQNKALNLALVSNGFYLIQGPPGTGKTFTAAHLIKQIALSGQKILVTADSNAAVDNLIRAILAVDEEVLRIGNPIRVNEDLIPQTLDYKMIHHFLFDNLNQKEEEIKELKKKQKQLLKPKQKHTRGLSPEQLLDVIKTNKSQHGLKRKNLKNYKPWIMSEVKLDQLYQQMAEIREQIRTELLASHHIIAATNSTAGSELLAYAHFDWLIIDEAAQASMPSSLIPLLKAERFVLLGDHFQLPPVVLSSEAKSLGLANSLMSDLARMYPYQLTMLNVQYRMNQKISNLVSKMFYSDKLIAHQSVAKRKIDKKIIEMIDIRGDERIFWESKSYFNQIEVNATIERIFQLLNKGVKASQIAIISPYKAQVKLLRKSLAKEIEIDTVDAFQGREKDIVIISFVRSNDYQGIGFLSDFRRLNVSISRAKKKLILIGDFAMLKQNQLFSRLLKTIKELK